jgi:hypothetical protein
MSRAGDKRRRSVAVGVVYGTLFAFLRNACAVWHLYSAPLYVVVRLMRATSRQARFILQALCVYAYSWM